MIKYLFLVLFSVFSLAENEIGWKGNSLSVGAINLKIQKSDTITGDDQQVDVVDNAAITINSDSPTQSSRTFVLGPGQTVGQKVVLVCFVTGANKSELVDDSAVPTAGSHKMAGDWACIEKWDNIELQWSGSHWIERSRSDV